MTSFKDKLIDEIIHRLVPLRTLYKEEIDTITNDLLNNQFESFHTFIETYYQDIFYSKELRKLVSSLVLKGMIPSNYLSLVNQTDLEVFQFTSIGNEKSVLLTGYKPLNIKVNVQETLKTRYQKNSFKENPKDSPLSKKNDTPPDLIEDELLILPDSYKEKRKKSIVEAQLNYLKNATSFIQELDDKTEEEIYKALLNLNDLRYIHHCISNLNSKTLHRFLTFIENRLQQSHNSMDIFIEEAIKLHLRNGKKM